MQKRQLGDHGMDEKVDALESMTRSKTFFIDGTRTYFVMMPTFLMEGRRLCRPLRMKGCRLLGRKMAAKTFF